MIYEFLGFLSILLIGYGCFLIYQPLAFLVPGIMIFVLVCFAIFAASKRQPQQKKG